VENPLCIESIKIAVALNKGLLATDCLIYETSSPVQQAGMGHQNHFGLRSWDSPIFHVTVELSDHYSPKFYFPVELRTAASFDTTRNHNQHHLTGIQLTDSWVSLNSSRLKSAIILSCPASLMRGRQSHYHDEIPRTLKQNL